MTLATTDEKMASKLHTITTVAGKDDPVTSGTVECGSVDELKGADKALLYVSPERIEVDEKTNKRIVRKIDLNLMPFIVALYFLQYLDKQMLSYASVMGIQTDANLTSHQYSWLGSIYYLGYLVAVYPHNRLFQRVNQTKYLACCAFIWGAVLCTMAACNDFTGLMNVRVFMGIFEASVSAGFLLITAKWYKKHEHASRVAWWGAGAAGAGGIGALLAFGCYRGSQKYHSAIYGWKIFALVTGGATVVFGVLMFFFMPNDPTEATWLSEEDKQLSIERLRDNHQGLGSPKFKWYQFREAFADIRTWLYVFFIFTSQIPLAGTSYFSSLLIKSLGYDSGTTLLLGMPGQFGQIFMLAFWGWLADRTKYRSLVAATAQLLTIFAISLQIGLAHVGLLYCRGGQLAAYFMLGFNGVCSFYLVLSMISSNTLGTTKKTTTNGIVFVSMATSYLVGPQMFIEAPYYTKAKIATLILWCCAFLTLIAIFLLNRRENAKRDRMAAAGEIHSQPGIEFQDLTDQENKNFRYVL